MNKFFYAWFRITYDLNGGTCVWYPNYCLIIFVLQCLHFYVLMQGSSEYVLTHFNPIRKTTHLSAHCLKNVFECTLILQCNNTIVQAMHLLQYSC